LPQGVNWSLYVALATIAATAAFGPRPPAPAPGRWPASRVRLTPLHVAFFLFGLCLVASYLTARKPEAGDLMVAEYWRLYLMFAVGVVVVRTVGQVWALYLVYALSLAYISYEINFLYFVNGYLGIVRNGYGGHDNNGAGMLLAMGVPLCAFAWEAYRGWYRWAFAAFIPVILHAVLMTYSRGAMVALVVAAPFWILRGRFRRQKVGLGLAVLACIPFLAGPQIRERFFSVGEYAKDDSANSRFTSWKIGLRIAVENPVFGVGVRNSPLLTYDYGADMPGRVIHSQYIQVAADNGFLGLACYLAVVGLAVWNLEEVIRKARYRDDPDSIRAYLAAAGFQGAIVTFLVGAVFLSCEAFEPQYWVFLAAAQLRLTYVGAAGPVAAYAPRPPWPVPRPVPA
ncbi:MAG TPA: O-antigen ligase family protein, partial [Urbifossiella sp.]|nr:O-antigen ligase family protein [Urbifossiella sp.]